MNDGSTGDPEIGLAWFSELVRHGSIPASALTRFPALHTLDRLDYREALRIAKPSYDRAWSKSDLVSFARTLVRPPEYADALVQVVIEAARPLGSASPPAPVLPWRQAVIALHRVREAVDVAASAPTLRSALRQRCEQWLLGDLSRPTLAELDGALHAVTPIVLRPYLTPETRIDEDAIHTIGRRIIADFEAAGDDDRGAAVWAVHDHSGRSDWSLQVGISYRIGRILVAAEKRMLGRYSTSFLQVEDTQQGSHGITFRDLVVFRTDCASDLAESALNDAMPPIVRRYITPHAVFGIESVRAIDHGIYGDGTEDDVEESAHVALMTLIAAGTDTLHPDTTRLRIGDLLERILDDAITMVLDQQISS